jgi:hypothetical protein
MPDDGTHADGVATDDEASGAATVEAYEVDGGVVLHDARNPFAWVEATWSVPVRQFT